MSEHGWPDFHDDHHGDGLHHDDDGALPQHDDVGAHDPDDQALIPDDHVWDAPADDHPADDHLAVHDAPYEHHAEETVEAPEDQPWTPPEHDIGPVGADPDALPDADVDQVSLFPQVVDVGPLPEPVDGFPWIDTGSLGLVDPADVHEPAAVEVTPQELAEYAGTDLPPGVDPWAALAGSEDPATSALARWWSEQQQ